MLDTKFSSIGSQIHTNPWIHINPKHDCNKPGSVWNVFLEPSQRCSCRQFRLQTCPKDQSVRRIGWSFGLFGREYTAVRFRCLGLRTILQKELAFPSKMLLWLLVPFERRLGAPYLKTAGRETLGSITCCTSSIFSNWAKRGQLI